MIASKVIYNIKKYVVRDVTDKKMQKCSSMIYILIPVFSVIFFRLFEVAQGEKNEEIIFGIMCGFIIDLICYIIRYVIKKQGNSN